MLQHAREIAPSVSWDILTHVKRTGGISVNELAALLKMSYMGVKQHCDNLKRRGYVDTWRRPKGAGRPEKIFRPTAKLDLVLPSWGGELSLGILALLGQSHGENAPERLLFNFLQQKVERWAAKLKSQTLKERAAEFVKTRNSEGWMCELKADEAGIRILEHHSPLTAVARTYPNIWEMELRLLERCFSVELEREKETGREILWLERLTPRPAPVAEEGGATDADEDADTDDSAAEDYSTPAANDSVYLDSESETDPELESESVSESESDIDEQSAGDAEPQESEISEAPSYDAEQLDEESDDEDGGSPFDEEEPDPAPEPEPPAAAEPQSEGPDSEPESAPEPEPEGEEPKEGEQEERSPQQSQQPVFRETLFDF